MYHVVVSGVGAGYAKGGAIGTVKQRKKGGATLYTEVGGKPRLIHDRGSKRYRLPKKSIVWPANLSG